MRFCLQLQVLSQLIVSHGPRTTTVSEVSNRQLTSFLDLNRCLSQISREIVSIQTLFATMFAVSLDSPEVTCKAID